MRWLLLLLFLSLFISFVLLILEVSVSDNIYDSLSYDLVIMILTLHYYYCLWKVFSMDGFRI